MAENRAKPILTETLVKEWQVSAKKGETIVQLADRLGMNKDSLSSRSSSLRRELREQGLTETQVQATMPALARVSTVKNGSKKSFLRSLAERVKAESEASAEASAHALETDVVTTKEADSTNQ
jgi:hypothetical protein